MGELVDIEDEAGTVVGKLDLTIMRAVAPHPELDRVIEAGGSIYMRKNGMRMILSIDEPRKRKGHRR